MTSMKSDSKICVHGWPNIVQQTNKILRLKISFTVRVIEEFFNRGAIRIVTDQNIHRIHGMMTGQCILLKVLTLLCHCWPLYDLNGW
jgi:hypothetical protein